MSDATGSRYENAAATWSPASGGEVQWTWLLGLGDPIWLGDGETPDPLDYGIHVEGCTCGCPDIDDDWGARNE